MGVIPLPRFFSCEDTFEIQKHLCLCDYILLSLSALSLKTEILAPDWFD